MTSSIITTACAPEAPSTVTSPANQSFEGIEAGELFVEKEGDLTFDHTGIVFKQGHHYFLTRLPTLRPSPISIDHVDVPSKTAIPAESIWPPLEPGITIMSEPLTAAHFWKKPSLLDHEDGDTYPAVAAYRLLQEARICEILKERPHPNIATHLGAVVEGNKMKGLVFTRYAKTLRERLDMEDPLDAENCLRSVEEGLRHLHSLDLVHNDLNPNNVMFDDEDHVVIIDFDTCKKEGSELGPLTGTWEWETTSRVALKENDLATGHAYSKYFWSHVVRLAESSGAGGGCIRGKETMNRLLGGGTWRWYSEYRIRP